MATAHSRHMAIFTKTFRGSFLFALQRNFWAVDQSDRSTAEGVHPRGFYSARSQVQVRALIAYTIFTDVC